MDEDMRQVEVNLGYVSRGCNSRVLEGAMRNYADFERNLRASGGHLTCRISWK